MGYVDVVAGNELDVEVGAMSGSIIMSGNRM